MKLLGYSIRILICLILSPLLIFIKLFTKIRFGFTFASRIGQLVTETHLFIRHQKLYKNKIILFTKGALNPGAKENFSPHIFFMDGSIWYYLFRSCLPLIRALDLYIEKPVFNTNYKEFDTFKVNYSPGKHAQKFGETFRQDFIGDKEFVCFHSRDNLYLESSQKNRDFSYHDYRDGDPNNLQEAIYFVAQYGLVPLRIGVIGKKLNADIHPTFVDYSQMKHNPYLDYYLIANCKFYVGAASGPLHLPVIFRKPYACINLIPFFDVPLCSNSIFATKLIMDKRTNQFLSFSECQEAGMFDKSNSETYSTEFYDRNMLEPIENSAEDILDITKDIILPSQEGQVDSMVKEIQEAYKRKYLTKTQSEFGGSLSPSFAKKYQHLI